MKKYLTPRCEEIELFNEVIIAASAAEEEDFEISGQEADHEVLRYKHSIWDTMKADSK